MVPDQPDPPPAGPTPTPSCQCGHADADHYAGFAFCKLCGPAACQHFRATEPGPAITDQPQYTDERWLVEFPTTGERPELHSTLEKAIEMRLRLLLHPPQTEAEIIRAVTSLNTRLKDAPAYLLRILHELAPALRAQVLQVLLAGLRRYVDRLGEAGRHSQAQLTLKVWEPWMNGLRLHIYRGLAQQPGDALTAALLGILPLLEDRQQWPSFTRDELPAARRPRNPYQQFAGTMRTALRKFRLGREVENDILKCMGIIDGEPVPPVE